MSYQPYPSGGQPVEPRPACCSRAGAERGQAHVRGAAVSTVSLIISLADIGGSKAAIRKARPSLSAAQVNQLNTFIITLAIVSGLVGIGLWLWMARANGRGKNWARIVSTVLFCLATLDLIGVFSEPKTALSLIFPILTWLVGLGAICLLWRPESTAFFKPQGLR